MSKKRRQIIININVNLPTVNATVAADDTAAEPSTVDRAIGFVLPQATDGDTYEDIEDGN